MAARLSARRGQVDAGRCPFRVRNTQHDLATSEVELKSLEKLGEIYAKDGRWREAFLTAQRASQIMPDHPITRRLEDAMGRRFENLFLDNEADKLPKVEALALYQEFRSLMPVGRRGDEIARRLADRLHELDLVDEAAEILEHQVRNRLEGIARASVATRLAVMHLQNRQPNKALTTLRTTRLANMPEDLRRPRAMLEARALGDLSAPTWPSRFSPMIAARISTGSGRISTGKASAGVRQVNPMSGCSGKPGVAAKSWMRASAWMPCGPALPMCWAARSWRWTGFAVAISRA